MSSFGSWRERAGGEMDGGWSGQVSINVTNDCSSSGLSGSNSSITGHVNIWEQDSTTVHRSETIINLLKGEVLWLSEVSWPRHSPDCNSDLDDLFECKVDLFVPQIANLKSDKFSLILNYGSLTALWAHSWPVWALFSPFEHHVSLFEPQAGLLSQWANMSLKRAK